MKVLIIEDAKETRDLLKYYLENEGIEVYLAINGEIGIEKIENEKPNIILLDLLLPDYNGVDICKMIKEDPDIYGNPVIIMLTGKNDQKSVNEGLRAQADDYIKKPFDIEEVILRINRYKNMFPDKIEYKDLIIDIKERDVVYIVEQEKIKLTKKEFDLLLFFIENKGLVISREKIINRIWGIDAIIENDSRINDQLKRLRKKIPMLKENLITIKGVGYKLI